MNAFANQLSIERFFVIVIVHGQRRLMNSHVCLLNVSFNLLSISLHVPIVWRNLRAWIETHFVAFFVCPERFALCREIMYTDTDMKLDTRYFEKPINRRDRQGQRR